MKGRNVEEGRNVEDRADLEKAEVQRACAGQSNPATPAESRHSHLPAVKLHALPLAWNFPLGKG